MARGFDIRLVGDKELQRAFKRLEVQMQRRIVRAGMRAAARKARDYVVANLSGRLVDVITGRTLAAFRRMRIRQRSRRGLVLLGLELPSRAELGIDASAKHYYPAALEYGHGSVAPRSFVRKAVDEHEVELRSIIAATLRRRIAALVRQ